MPQKEPSESKQHYTEVVYLAYTRDGREHQISRENYEELKPLVKKAETYGAYIANEDTDNELVFLMRELVSIKKDRRTIE